MCYIILYVFFLVSSDRCIHLHAREGGAAGHSMVFAKPVPFQGYSPKPMTPNHLVATNAVEDSIVLDS